MHEDENGVARWDLHAVKLTHFDGNERPGPVLQAVDKWLEETNVAPNKIIVDHYLNSDSGVYEYTATVEWDSKFVVKCGCR